MRLATLAGPPAPPQSADDKWRRGRCWLWCGRADTRVAWIGPATTLGSLSADMYACEFCLMVLHDQIWDEVMAADRGARKNGAAVSDVRVPDQLLQPGTGRHRRQAPRSEESACMI